MQCHLKVAENIRRKKSVFIVRVHRPAELISALDPVKDFDPNSYAIDL